MKVCTCHACYDVASAGYAEEHQPLPFSHHAASLWVGWAKHTLDWSFRVAVASKLTAQSVKSKRDQENVCVHDFTDGQCDMHIQVKLPAVLIYLCINMHGSSQCHMHMAGCALSMLNEDLCTPSLTRTRTKPVAHNRHDNGDDH